MKISNQELTASYDRYAHVLFRRCRAILGDDQNAHDAVQDTFAKVIVHAAEFRQQASPLTWMYRISTNRCLNHLRDRSGRAAKLDQRQGELGPAPDDAPGAALDNAKVLALLEEADDETRQCVVHTYFDDCTREEVATLVRISVPTVRKRINTFLDAPNEGGRPSRLNLDRFATGELVGDERQAVQGWLFGGAERFEHLETLRLAKQAVPKIDLADLRARALALAPGADVAPADDAAAEPDAAATLTLADEPSSAGATLAQKIVSGAYVAPKPHEAPTPGAVARRQTDPQSRRTPVNVDAHTVKNAPQRELHSADPMTPEPQIAVRMAASPTSSGAARAAAGMPRNAALSVPDRAPTAANRPWWIAVPFGLAAVIALLLAVGQFTGNNPGTTDVGPGINFRSGDKIAAFTVTGDTRSGYDGRPLGAGDVLAFQVVLGAASGVVVMSIDGTGAVTVFEPATGEAPTPVGPSPGPVALPATVVLDGAPGPAVFVVGFDHPVAFVVDGATAAWRTGGPNAVVRWAEENGGDAVVINRK